MKLTSSVRYKILNSIRSCGFRISHAERGANPQGEGTNLLLDQILAENCMKMKEIGPRGRGALDPPMNRSVRIEGCC